MKQVWFPTFILEGPFTFKIDCYRTMGKENDRSDTPRAIAPSSGGVTPVTCHKTAAAGSTVHIIENDNGSDSSSHTSRSVSVVTLKTAERNAVHLFESINQSIFMNMSQTWGLFLHSTVYNSLSGCYKLLYIHSPHTVQTNQNEAAQSSKSIYPSFSGPPSGSLSCNFSINYSVY